MSQALFIVFGAMAVVAALLAVTRTNLVASAIWLVVMFFGLAGTYVVLEAFFVGAVQILVYAGAIMVLFLFVIMLLDLREESLEGKHPPLFRFMGVLGCALFAAVCLFALLRARDDGLLEQTATRTRQVAVLDEAGDPIVHDGVPQMRTEEFEVVLGDEPLDGSAEKIAEQLFTRWLLPFEVTSILLLGAILGAVILTKRRLT